MLVWDWSCQPCCRQRELTTDADGDAPSVATGEFVEAPTDMTKVSPELALQFPPCEGEADNTDGLTEGLPTADPLPQLKWTRCVSEGASHFVDVLKDICLFHGLGDQERLQVMEILTNRVYNVGEVVIREGEDGAEFFIIRAGTAMVSTLEEQELAELHAGDWFGERALLSNTPRMATVTAITPLSVLVMTRETFHEMGLPEKVRLTYRKGIMPPANHQSQLLGARQVSTESAKSERDRDFITAALLKNQNLCSMVTMTDAILRRLAASARVQAVGSGDLLYEDGATDERAQNIYVVKSGKFMSFSAPTASGRKTMSAESARSNRHHRQNNVTTLGPGSCLGEHPMMFTNSSVGSCGTCVQSMEDSEVWVIDPAGLSEVIQESNHLKTKQYATYLDSIKLFDSLHHQEKEQIVDMMEETMLDKGEVIIKQGDDGDTFYILIDGRVRVHVDGIKKVELSASVADKTFQFFGERALLTEEKRSATVTVTSPTASLLTFDRDSFKFLMGPVASHLDAGDKDKAKNRKPAGPLSVKDLLAARKYDKRGRIPKKELRRIGCLGFGGFGVVDLMEHTVSKKTFALKTLSKGHVVKSHMQQVVVLEKDLCLLMDSPFLTRFYESYNYSQALYFLFEALLGGDLYSVYTRKGLHGSEAHCKYFVANMVFGLLHLHRLKIVFRDLKPENVLISDRGLPKLADFDCAKFITGKTFTVRGTPEYFAPEIVDMRGHSFGADWWSLGILAFELMAGYTPFMDDSPLSQCAKIKKGLAAVKMPKQLTPNAEELVRALVAELPGQRLPLRRDGVKQLQELKVFSGLSWAKIKDQTEKPAYLPDVRSRLREAARFTARPEDMPPEIAYTPDGTNWDKDFATCK